MGCNQAVADRAVDLTAVDYFVRHGAKHQQEVKLAIHEAFASLGETFEARASEWALASAMMLLAFMAFYNVTLFDSPSFRVMASMADQYTWGWIFMTVGASRLAVLLINGAWWRTPAFRTLFSFMSVGVWFWLTLGLSGNFAIGFAVFPPMMALDFYNALRAARETGISYYIHMKAGGRENVGINAGKRR